MDGYHVPSAILSEHSIQMRHDKYNLPPGHVGGAACCLTWPVASMHALVVAHPAHHE